STRKDNETLRLPAVIHSKTDWMNVADSPACRAAYTSANTPQLNRKDPNTTPLPNSPTTDLGNTFLPIPLIRKPSSGNNGINQIKSIIFCKSFKSSVFNLHVAASAHHHHPLKRFSALMSTERVFRYTITIMANPTATSAAASAMMKNTNTCPPGSP